MGSGRRILHVLDMGTALDVLSNLVLGVMTVDCT